jgi:hypothetical protein
MTGIVGSKLQTICAVYDTIGHKIIRRPGNPPPYRNKVIQGSDGEVRLAKARGSGGGTTIERMI